MWEGNIIRMNVSIISKYGFNEVLSIYYDKILCNFNCISILSIFTLVQLFRLVLRNEVKKVSKKKP